MGIDELVRIRCYRDLDLGVKAVEGTGAGPETRKTWRVAINLAGTAANLAVSMTDGRGVTEKRQEGPKKACIQDCKGCVWRSRHDNDCHPGTYSTQSTKGHE